MNAFVNKVIVVNKDTSVRNNKFAPQLKQVKKKSNSHNPVAHQLRQLPEKKNLIYIHQHRFIYHQTLPISNFSRKIYLNQFQV